MQPTVIFDFDGVIHSYISGWHGANIVADPPVEGIKESIQDIRSAGYRVVVVSSRCYQDGGIQAIKDYLKIHGIEVDDITHEKPPAIVSIDDRAITFDGRSETLLEKIRAFRTWNGKDV